VLWLTGVRDAAPDVVEIVVPHARRVVAPRGSVVVRRRGRRCGPACRLDPGA